MGASGAASAMVSSGTSSGPAAVEKDSPVVHAQLRSRKAVVPPGAARPSGALLAASSAMAAATGLAISDFTAGRSKPKNRTSTNRPPAACLPTSHSHGCSHNGWAGSGSGIGGSTKAVVVTLTMSPRVASKPIASLTNCVMRSTSTFGAKTGTGGGLLPSWVFAASAPSATGATGAGGGSRNTTATERRRMVPSEGLVWLIVRSSS